MSEVKKVKISDYKIATFPETLMTVALGSCVGIAIYDPVTKIGGLSHVMLPDSTVFKAPHKTEKFADLAIPQMVQEIKAKTNSAPLVAKIAGGASMFQLTNSGNGEGIGERNIKAVIATLNALNIPIVAEHTGSNIGRTMVVELEDFKVTIRNASRNISVL